MLGPARSTSRHSEATTRLTRGRRRFRQMRHAILFAIARNAKIEVRIAQFGRTAYCAFVKRFGFASGTPLITLSSGRDLAAMAGIVNNFWSKKDQIIGQGSHQRHAIGIRTDKKTEQ